MKVCAVEYNHNSVKMARFCVRTIYLKWSNLENKVTPCPTCKWMILLAGWVVSTHAEHHSKAQNSQYKKITMKY